MKKKITFKSKCGKIYTEKEYKQLASEQESSWHKVCADNNCECEVHVVKHIQNQRVFKIVLSSPNNKTHISICDPETNSYTHKTISELTKLDIVNIIERGIHGHTTNPLIIRIYNSYSEEV